MQRSLLGLLTILAGCSLGNGPSDSEQVNAEPVEWQIGETVYDCPECPPLVTVPGVENAEEPLFIMRRELTWGDYVPAIIEADCPKPQLQPGYEYPDDITPLADNYPLTWVAPIKIVCYLDWLKEKSGHTYRLPTPAEWEHAARAGSTTRFPWGDDPGYNRAAVNTWFDPKPYDFDSRKTRDPRLNGLTRGGMVPVEQFEPNQWGLYDVVGSVQEYVDDIRPRMQNNFPCNLGESEDACLGHIARGGKIYTITHRVGVGQVGEDTDFMVTETRYFHGLDQSPGYRFVRDDEK